MPGLDRVVAIAAGIGSIAGGGTSGAVRDDGTVWMWGSNASAMIGNGLGPLSPDDVGGRVLGVEPSDVTIAQPPAASHSCSYRKWL